MKQKFFITLFIVAFFILLGCTNEEQLIGGQQDEHGCLIAAGYQWCPSGQKCMRMWEEYCKEYADQYRVNEQTRGVFDLGSFCGSSTLAKCEADSDCWTGGCSAQLCRGISEEIDTTCEWRDCYNSQPYGVECGCVQSQCQWFK